MSTTGALNFTPVPLHTGLWKAEVTGLIYTLFRSPSGFVVHTAQPMPGRSGETPASGAPRGLYPTFEAAVEACNSHYRNYMK